MVYETDFYTVRRPYSRPTITSYSVTAPRVSSWKVKPSVRTSVLIGELDRIYHRPRPHLGYAPLEDFLNSRPLVDFDDETKLIRAETDRLMRRIYTSVPRPRSLTPLKSLPYIGYQEKPRPHNAMVDDILSMSYYSEPTARTIGRGHLACVSFAGGRGYPRRKHLFSDEYRDIGDEIKCRSYYNNNYNKAYVDSMSLPTGFASYLLRIKPPEKNECLTNLDKMHIIALAEERKKNKEKSKQNEEINSGKYIDKLSERTKLLNGFASPSEEDTIKPVKSSIRSVPKYEYLPEERKTDANHVRDLPVVKEEKGNIIKSQVKTDEIISEPTRVSQVPVEPEQKPEEIIEPPKPEKKIKKKTSSISKVPSVDSTPLNEEEKVDSTPLNEEVKVDSTPLNEEVKVDSTPLNVEDRLHKTEILEEKEDTEKVDTPIPSEEKTELGELPQQDSQEPTQVDLQVTGSSNIEEASEDSQAEAQEKNPQVELENEELKTEPLREEKQAEFESTSEIEPTESNETNEAVAAVSLPTESVISEWPVESEKEIQEKLEANDEKLSESALDFTVQHGQAEEPPQEIVADIELKFEEPTENQNVTENIEDSIPTEQEPALDSSEKDVQPEDIILQENSESHLIDSSNSEAPTQEIPSKESISENPPEPETEELQKENRSYESTEPENLIEEVTDIGISETPKENESEPLVEEPQSPTDYPDIMSEKNKSNDICEVLSDVAEES